MEKYLKKAVLVYIVFRIVTLAAAHFLFKVENGIYLVNPKWTASCMSKTIGPKPECVELKFEKKHQEPVTQE